LFIFADSHVQFCGWCGVCSGVFLGALMRKVGFCTAFDPAVLDAIDGAVRYFKYTSRGDFIRQATEYYLNDLHKDLAVGKSKNESK